MTQEEWLEKARQDKELLLILVREFHPVYLAQKGYTHGLRITAPNVERIRRGMLPAIAKTKGMDPIQQFEAALESKDVETLVSILNKAWFGVPESTDCWLMPGFAEACDLLDDPPYGHV